MQKAVSKQNYSTSVPALRAKEFVNELMICEEAVKYS